jgi:hypothetical protein
LKAWELRRFFSFFMFESSFVHHRLAKGEGLDMGTEDEMVSCRVLVRATIAEEIWSGEFNLEGGGSEVRRCERFVLNSFQSVPRKLREGGEWVLSGGMLSMLMIGR